MMILMTLMNNKTKQIFEKTFYSEKKFKSFKKKVEKGKSLTILSIWYDEL